MPGAKLLAIIASLAFACTAMELGMIGWGCMGANIQLSHKQQEYTNMGLTKPGNGDTVWIEYPEGKHFRALYDSQSDTFTPQGERPIKATDVANWSYEEHEDYDISDAPQADKGSLTRS